MNIIIFIVSLIELLFLILGSFYLIKKTKIKHINKYMMILIYFVILVILNVNIISMYSFNYSKKLNSSELDLIKEEIKILENEISENNNKLEELSKKVETTNILSNELEDLNKENDIYIKEIETKNKELDELNNKLDNLNKEYDSLYKETEFVISPFPTYHQFPNYPNGCESVALHLLLKYNGVDVSVESIVEVLKKGDRPFRENGKLYGGDPEVEFVGDPRSTTGYGVYEKPIIDVAEKFKSGIKNITGSNLSDVLKIVRTGKPVQVWVSINLRNTYVCSTWTATSTGRTVNWLCGLHSLVVIGYTYDEIVTSDPYTGKIEYYDRTQFEKMYNTYGKRALYYE